MKTLALCFLAIATTAHAEIVAQWNFNNTNDPATSPVPSVGSGTASFVGGAAAPSSGAFPSGSGSTDPSTTNTAWNTSTYPAQGTSNKTAGVQLAVNTTGYTNLSVSFDTKDSNTGSKYTRLQYTTNGVSFMDAIVITNSTAFGTKSNSFVGVPGVDNNPNFAIRIVAEWESTAIGTTSTNYIAASTTYGTSGTIRYDMMTVWGTLFGTLNTPPTITGLTNQTTRVNQATNQSFTIGDLETPATSLVVTGASSNPLLVPNANIVVSTGGSNRTVTVTPAAGQLGTALITLTVVDAGTLTAAGSFTLTVLPANTPPILTGLGTTNTLMATPVTVPFTIGDLETPASNLNVTATSTYTTILPNSGLALGGSGSNRTVTITPAAGQTGVAVVNVQVSDGSMSTNYSFAVMVLPAPTFVFTEPFTYSDGPLIDVTGHLWNRHSGGTSEVAVAGGQAFVAEIYTEDVNAPLAGAPYTTNGTGSLYTKFKLNFAVLPAAVDPSTNVPNYFLHLKDDGGVNFRARVFVCTTNAPDGQFKLAIANATSTNYVQYPTNLDPGVDYTVVTRYDLASGISTLWVNPSAETDFSVTAVDPVNLAPITTIALRESSGIGMAAVDDLVVTTTFASALGNTNQPPVISTIGNQTTPYHTPTAAIPVTIGDAQTAAATLTLSAGSSNPALVPTNAIVFDGSDSNRNVTVTPALGQSGAAYITVVVKDGDGQTASTSFLLTVLPQNNPPTISTIPNQAGSIDTPTAAIPFTVGDLETSAGSLTLSGTSTNQTLVPNANIIFGGSGSNRTVTVTPAPGQYGTTAISVQVSDGTNTTSTTFTLRVGLLLLLADSFSYADGSVTTNSGFLWNAHSGTTGQTQVATGKLLLTSTQSEDFNAGLTNQPYAPASSAVLYAGFTVNFSALPGSQFFAHFKDNSTGFRCRVFATLTNATAGSFRLGIANNVNNVAATNPPFAQDLALNTDCRVIMRYDVASGISTLWVNPASEGDPSVTATDTPSTMTVTSFAFRQAAGIGSFSVDNLLVGASFATVLGEPVGRPSMRVARSGSALVVSWPANYAGFALETSTNIPATNWTSLGTSFPTDNGRFVNTNNSPAGTLFYRLKK